MNTSHTLKDLKYYHSEASNFFAAQLLLVKETVNKITTDKQAKAGVLLISAGQTGTALLQLSNQLDVFSSEPIMLARSFIEKLVNFCYVGLCDDQEYRAFILHPVYKNYHLIGSRQITDWQDVEKFINERKAKQEILRTIPIVQEALSIFSEKRSNLNWTKKSLNQRIDVIIESKKVLDVFFSLCKSQYYSDGSEALHGSLYGCTFSVGAFDSEFDHTDLEELDKKLIRDNTCMLLHMGMLIHECLTLISYSDDIKKYWAGSYENRNAGLSLLMHVSEVKLDIPEDNLYK